MKQVVFTVNEKKSYIKSLGWPDVKSTVTLPLIVPLTPGGTIALTIDDTKYVAQGGGSGLQFITNQFKKSSSYNITGNFQTISVKLSNLDLNFDPKTGKILNGGGYTFVMGEPQAGWAGALALWYLGPSALLDANSPSFDIANGLGCGGGLVLEMGSGNPTDFIIHIEATVGKEDADGDGKFERFCPSGVWKMKLNLEYDRPKIRIIVPNHDPMNRWRSGFDIIHAIRFPDFLKLVKNFPHTLKETPRIDRIELVGAPDLWLMLFDSNGMVYGGSLSDERTKVIKMPPVDLENLLIGIMPNLGVSLDRTNLHGSSRPRTSGK